MPSKYLAYPTAGVADAASRGCRGFYPDNGARISRFIPRNVPNSRPYRAQIATQEKSSRNRTLRLRDLDLVAHYGLRTRVTALFWR
jgi:hypothetical protein